MCLQPGEEIGNEVHAKVDQFFRIEEGQATFVFEGKEKVRLKKLKQQSIISPQKQ